MASTATPLDDIINGEAFGRGDSQYREHRIDVVCDATPSAVEDCLMPVNNMTAGEIVAVAVVMPGGLTFPDSVTVTIKDQHEVIIYTGSITGAASKAERLLLSDGLNSGNISFIGPLTVSHSGNTTASATWSTYILVA